MAVNIDHTDDFFLDHFPYYNCQEGDRLIQTLFLTKALAEIVYRYKMLVGVVFLQTLTHVQ